MEPPLLQRNLIGLGCLCLSLLSQREAWAKDLPEIMLGKIQISGLHRTEERVVRQELRLKENQITTQEQLESSIDRLRATGLFQTVEYSLQEMPDGNTLKITLKERWTTIPILKFASGGGVQQYILGLYDPNILGQFLEGGGQYERLGVTDSGVLWFKWPHLLGHALSLDLQAWKTNRLRTKYLQDRVQPEILTGFLHKRDKIYLGLDAELNDWIILGVFYEYNNDRFTTQYLDEETKEKALNNGLPPDSEVAFQGYKLKLGKLSENDTTTEGLQGILTYTRAHSLEEGLDDFQQTDLGIKWGLPFASDYNLVGRLLAGTTTTKILQYWYYLGGLDRVRGFSDNRFAGSRFWLSNLEFRAITYRAHWFYLQNNIFYDVVSAGESDSTLTKPTGASVGLGLRILSPKIYRFVGRIDIAKPVLKQDGMPISFGVQQFF